MSIILFVIYVYIQQLNPNIINTILTEFKPVCVIQSRVVEEQGGSIYLCQLFVSIVNWVIKLKNHPFCFVFFVLKTHSQNNHFCFAGYYLKLLFACQSFLISFIFQLHASKPMNFFQIGVQRFFQIVETPHYFVNP